MTSPRLPDLDDCVTVYLDVWDVFGTDTFSVGDLVVELHQRETDTDLLDGVGPQRQIDLLTAYGLLEQVSGDRYRVRCQPDETQLEWWEQLEDQVEELHDAVHEKRRTVSEGGDRPLLTYRGHTYVSLFVDEGTPIADVIDEVHEINNLHDGVALRSPATLANEVQDIADELCSVTRDGIEPFEKVNSEVKGSNSDDLEFRLFIAPR